MNNDKLKTCIFLKWLFTLNPFQVCILLSNSVFLFQFKDMHLFQGNYCMSKYLFMAWSHLSFSNTKVYWGNLSVPPSQLSLSGLWTRTHVVNLCLWSGWRTPSGQMLRQSSHWPRRIRRRNMPIRLFVLPSFHSAAQTVGHQPAGGETVEG